jgi:mannosyltransferase OCH1-like enzyme
MIPKVFHYVWLGDAPMHPLMVQWREAWGELHPGWTVKVWRERGDLPSHALACYDEVVECRYPAYLASCPTYAKRSDVWRYDLLEQHGGVYLDADVEPVKCVEALIGGESAFAGLCNTRYGWTDDDPVGRVVVEVGCSIMGAAPHHPWLQDLVLHVPEQDPVEQLALAFPYLTRVTARHPEVRLYPPETFYSVPWDHYALGGKRSLRREAAPEAAYAVHRWSSNWFAGGLRRLDEGRAPEET